MDQLFWILETIAAGGYLCETQAHSEHGIMFFEGPLSGGFGYGTHTCRSKEGMRIRENTFALNGHRYRCSEQFGYLERIFRGIAGAPSEI